MKQNKKIAITHYISIRFSAIIFIMAAIMILFISFIIAFSGKFKATVLYTLFGVVLIYILNVLRIAVLTVLLFYFS